MEEFKLWIDGSEQNLCRFRLETSSNTYETDFTITAGWIAQLSRLQWKAGYLLEEDDAFLAEVSAALASAIFLPSRRDVWKALLAGEPSVLRFVYGNSSDATILLPLELLSIEGRYLVDIPDLQLVREFRGGYAGTTTALEMPPELRILHISWGDDPALELRSERKALLSALPHTPMSFLFSPTLELLGGEIRRFKPTVAHISSHGSFDDIGGQHGVYLDESEQLATTKLLDVLRGTSVQMVFLASCQSALAATNMEDFRRVTNSIEIAGFTFPIETKTAQAMMTALYQQLGRGIATGTAMAFARNAHTEDVFSSFSLVHTRPYEKPFLTFSPASTDLATRSVDEFESSEALMVRLDAALRTYPVLSVLAPAGFGARTSFREWRRLQERSGLIDFNETSDTELIFQWELHGEPHLARIVRFYEFDPATPGHLLIVGRTGDLESLTDISDGDALREIATVGPMAAGVPRIRRAILAGESAIAALQAILVQNRLDARIGALDPQGRQLIEHLIGLGGVSSLSDGLPLAAWRRLLKFVERELWYTEGFRTLADDVRLFVTWTHADRLFRIMTHAGVDPKWIRDYFGEGATRLPAEVVSGDGNYVRDIAHPDRIDKWTLTLAMIAYASENGRYIEADTIALLSQRSQTESGKLISLVVDARLAPDAMNSLMRREGDASWLPILTPALVELITASRSSSALGEIARTVRSGEGDLGWPTLRSSCRIMIDRLVEGLPNSDSRILWKLQVQLRSIS